MTPFPRITLLSIVLSVLNAHIRSVSAQDGWIDLADFHRRAASSRNVPAAGYYVPQDGGGAMLTVRVLPCWYELGAHPAAGGKRDISCWTGRAVERYLERKLGQRGTR